MKTISPKILLLLSLIALNNSLTVSLKFDKNFRTHCQSTTIRENVTKIEKIIEKLSTTKQPLTNLECLLLNNYLTRFKYYYYRFFSLSTKSHSIVQKSKDLNTLAIQSLFLLMY